MPLFSSRKSKAAASAAAPPLPPAPPAEPSELIYYTVRSPWEWVMHEVAKTGSSSGVVPMKQVDSSQNLPSGLLKSNAAPPTTATPNIQRRRSVLKRGPVPCTLRLEVCRNSRPNKNGDNNNNNSSSSPPSLAYALHGTSAGLDGLEDKDELVRTMQRCRCDHLGIGPPSILIKWDITRDELDNYVPSLPTLLEQQTQTDNCIAVLKEPMGSRGEGIYFVRNNDEAFAHIDRHRVQALEAPDLLDNIMAQKGRMPAWVLQAEVYPPMRIMGGRRKFHIRTNVAIVEKLEHDDLVDVYIHNRHEVRIAGQEVGDIAERTRDPLAHITNGANSDTTQRALLGSIPELSAMQDELHVFCAKAFQAFMPDIIRRVGYSASQETTSTNIDIRKFVIAGVDIMVTERGRFYLLEVNVNPVAPPEDSVDPAFKQHLIGWMADLCDLTLGRPCPNFVNVNDIAPRA